jgi:hypothetical protein
MHLNCVDPNWLGAWPLPEVWISTALHAMLKCAAEFPLAAAHGLPTSERQAP